MKRFNTTAVCIPSKHYMVDISDKIAEISELVDNGEYFVINRARQYGKTTTLSLLGKALAEKYVVISISFEGITRAGFASENSFVKAFCKRVQSEAEDGLSIPPEAGDLIGELVKDESNAGIDELFAMLKTWCRVSEKPVVLMIDEVDSAANNDIFIDFLGALRNNYINREAKGTITFQSVILAGVTDIKHIRSKIRDDQQHKVNSPWNIAADFDVDMSLSEVGIKGMLDEYEADHHTGMDTGAVAKQIREYTSGYPFLVSRICQIIDEKLVPSRFASLSDAWTEYGVDEAVRRILSEDNSLFDSLMGKLTNYPELKKQLRDILLKGETISYIPDDEEQKQLRMYGFIYNNHNTVAVSNRIFEMRLYNYFIGESNKYNDLKQAGSAYKSIFVDSEGRLDIPKIMEHFIAEHNRLHPDPAERFLEEEGRERFVTYLAAIINGTGTYSIEEQTRGHRRMDVVVHYLGRRYIIELKIWRGDRYNSDGEKQIGKYLAYFGLDTGYMLSFNFNRNKEPGVRRVQVGDKTLFEGIV